MTMHTEMPDATEREHRRFLTDGVKEILLGAWETDGTGIGSVMGEGMITVLVRRYHRLAGFFTIDGRFPPKAPDLMAWQLEHAYLAPRFRGKGLSGDLCEAMKEWASPFGLFFRAPVAPVMRHHAKRLGILVGEDVPPELLICDSPDEPVDYFAIIGCAHASRTCADCAQKVTEKMAAELVDRHLELPSSRDLLSRDMYLSSHLKRLS